MEQTNSKTKAQEQQTAAEPTTPRAWVTPTFERVSLNEALAGTSFTGSDGTFYS